MIYYFNLYFIYIPITNLQTPQGHRRQPVVPSTAKPKAMAMGDPSAVRCASPVVRHMRMLPMDQATWATGDV